MRWFPFILFSDSGNVTLCSAVRNNYTIFYPDFIQKWLLVRTCPLIFSQVPSGAIVDIDLNNM
jgi:hypothetical protein